MSWRDIVCMHHTCHCVYTVTGYILQVAHGLHYSENSVIIFVKYTPLTMYSLVFELERLKRRSLFSFLPACHCAYKMNCAGHRVPTVVSVAGTRSPDANISFHFVLYTVYRIRPYSVVFGARISKPMLLFSLKNGHR